MANIFKKEADQAAKRSGVLKTVLNYFIKIVEYVSKDPAYFVKLKAKAIISIGYIFPSFIFIIIDYWIMQYGIKIFLLLYIFVPLFDSSIFNYTISDKFFSFFQNDTNYTLTSMYLLAPLITLYFREHDNIVSNFIADYEKKEVDTNENTNLLSQDRDDYDLMSTGTKLAVLCANKRLLEERSLLLFNFERIALFIGKKRQKAKRYASLKIIFIIILLIPGMLMSGAPKQSIYYLLSVGILLFIMLVIFIQILYALRTTAKTIVYHIALDASYYIYQDMIKEDESSPGDIFINQ